jgi:hypothetical protein
MSKLLLTRRSAGIADAPPPDPEYPSPPAGMTLYAHMTGSESTSSAVIGTSFLEQRTAWDVTGTTPPVGNPVFRFGLNAGTFAGTVQFEITLDGTNFVAVEATAVGNSQTLATTATAPSVWKFDAIGAMAIRVRSTAWTSGLATVTIVGLGG